MLSFVPQKIHILILEAKVVRSKYTSLADYFAGNFCDLSANNSLEHMFFLI